ncbi:DUF5681 domain-containing protein [Bradyrhizobium liaoningense]|uniref:DUF5681 domain-containing protein n=1 Tax=Bradyrhizobium liaoningense TaxID=43992 RepID=UPI001BAD6D12|nr:DUF5681 domain-containing protein [Bradyrhizobium liaoningense]MBR0901202.1 hypothetical protein [Bradyrhizobium liaoningense]
MRNKGHFKPGQSGNPGGRTPIVKEVQELARTHTTDAIEGLARIAKDKKAPAAARVSAWNALLDRAYGKPPQSIDADATQALIVNILKFSQDNDG